MTLSVWDKGEEEAMAVLDVQLKSNN